MSQENPTTVPDEAPAPEKRQYDLKKIGKWAGVATAALATFAVGIKVGSSSSDEDSDETPVTPQD